MKKKQPYQYSKKTGQLAKQATQKQSVSKESPQTLSGLSSRAVAVKINDPVFESHFSLLSSY